MQPAGRTPVASLPMYDWPEVAWANDALWTAIAGRLRAAGVAAPKAMDRAHSSEVVWHDPALLLSQTCGLPFSTRLRGIVRLVAVPIYDVPGCDGPLYSSVIVTRRSEPAGEIHLFAGRRFACNMQESLSGNLVLRVAMKESGLDPAAEEWIETGSHRASVRAVAAGEADIAAIDAICWALALRYEPEAAAGLRVITSTPLLPALPFITAVERSDAEVATIRMALKDALADPATEEAREAVHLARVTMLDEWDYVPIARMSRRLAN